MQRESNCFDSRRNMIFEAGNEFRRFKMVLLRYAGLGVGENILFRPAYPRRVNCVCSQAPVIIFMIKPRAEPFRHTAAGRTTAIPDRLFRRAFRSSSIRFGGKYLDGEMTGHPVYPL